MTVITFSRQYGSGGDEIAGRVSALLSYHQFNKLLITKAAVEAGFSEHEVIDYSEDIHKAKNFIDRLLGRTHPLAQGSSGAGDAVGTRASDKWPFSEAAALVLVQQAVRAACQAGNMVIVGRGGQAILKAEPDVVHIRIEAPLEDRIQRVRDQLKEERKLYQADLLLRRAAQDLIIERDAGSADYIRTYYQVDWADPLLYHAVFNTGRLTIEQAAQSIVDLVHHLQPDAT